MPARTGGDFFVAPVNLAEIEEVTTSSSADKNAQTHTHTHEPTAVVLGEKGRLSSYRGTPRQNNASFSRTHAFANCFPVIKRNANEKGFVDEAESQRRGLRDGEPARFVGPEHR